MKISIIGAGYVGLVTGVCLAEKGHQVACVDLTPSVVDRINRGVPTIFESGLEELLRRHVGRNIHATLDLRSAVLESNVTMIAVGTPFDGQQIDLRFVRQATDQIGATLRDKDDFHVVAVKSTVVPGTTDSIVRPLLETTSGKTAGVDFGVGTNPEFLSEGTAVRDFLEPDRIVLGGSEGPTLEILEDIYDGFGDVQRIRTNNSTAEAIKYASNSLLATLISFANEMGNLCSALGDVDVVDVMRGVHSSQYLSPAGPDRRRIAAPICSFLQAGCGFGGSCLPKDVNALIRHGEKLGQSMPLLKAVMEINDGRPHRMLTLLRRRFATLRDLRVAVLGLSFKPGTDDIRLSPAIPVVRLLLAEGAEVSAYDPIANDASHQVFGEAPIRYCQSLDEAVADAEALMLVTQWDEFAQIESLIATSGNPPVVIDGRRMFDPNQFEHYEGIGA